MNTRHFSPRGREPSEATVLVYFSPERTDKELFDELAEKQADALEINSAQLRRFFGEIKDLYRQYNTLIAAVIDPEKRQEIYVQKIEPRFKMVRSKIFYAKRSGGQANLNFAFAQFLEQGISRVTDHQQFLRYVAHLEAVVGFMYGKGKVKS